MTDDVKPFGAWLTRLEGKPKPYVRGTSTADIWEFVWPDVSGNGNDAVRKLTPADVAEIIADRDRLALRVHELEKTLRSAAGVRLKDGQ
jgi:hypothetical protein